MEDGEKLENMKVDSSGKLQIDFVIFGHPKVRYQNTIYINHEAVASKQGSSVETLLTNEDVNIVSISLDLDKLNDFNTFYVISVPINANDFPNDVVALEKTPSILLYK